VKRLALILPVAAGLSRKTLQFLFAPGRVWPVYFARYTPPPSMLMVRISAPEALPFFRSELNACL